MVVPSYTNTQRAEHLLQDFTKGTKRGRKLPVRTDTLPHLTASLGGAGGEGEDGKPAPQRGSIRPRRGASPPPRGKPG